MTTSRPAAPPDVRPAPASTGAERPRAGGATTSAGGRGARFRTVGLGVAVLALVAMAALSLALGAKDLDITTVWHALGHDDGSEAAYIVRDLRLPRTILAVLVGLALGLAGAVMQALTRNPLADPGLFGIEMGASAAVVVAVSLLGVTSPLGFVWFAFAGAGAVAIVVYTLGSTGRFSSPDRLVLAGAGVTAALNALVTALLLVDGQAFDRYRFWVIGSLSGRDFALVWQLGPFIAVGALLALSLGRGLNALALGEETGQALGVSILRLRCAGALAVVLLSGAATAVAGPIGFVGLAVPHIARLIVGRDNRWVLAYSAVLAAVLLLAADLVGRLVIAPSELEVGIVMAFLGAPVFIVLCRRRQVARL